MNLFITTLSIVATSFSFAGCDDITISNNDNQAKVNGNGNVQTQERPISTFDKIEINGVFNVFLSQGDKEQVKVETDENLQSLIVSSVTNNVLSVTMRDSASIGKMKKINIYISVVHLSSITTNGVGKLKCTSPIKVSALSLDCKGVGLTELNVEGDKLSVNSETVGELKLSGTMKETSIKHSGLGLINAFGLLNEKLNLDVDGIGAAEVYASKDLTITSNGVGGVRYKGNPAVKRIKNEGIGKVVED